MNTPGMSRHDRCREIMRLLIDRYVREVETVGDCELSQWLDRMRQWVGIAKAELETQYGSPYDELHVKNILEGE